MKVEYNGASTLNEGVHFALKEIHIKINVYTLTNYSPLPRNFIYLNLLTLIFLLLL